MNGKTAVLRDTRGEQRKEEEKDVELVEGWQLHTTLLPSILLMLMSCIEWMNTIGTLLGSVAKLRDKCEDFETGITNSKSAVLRDTRGEHGKEEEDVVTLVERCQLHTIFLPSTLVLLVGKLDGASSWTWWPAKISSKELLQDIQNTGLVADLWRSLLSWIVLRFSVEMEDGDGTSWRQVAQVRGKRAFETHHHSRIWFTFPMCTMSGWPPLQALQSFLDKGASLPPGQSNCPCFCFFCHWLHIYTFDESKEASEIFKRQIKTCEVAMWEKAAVEMIRRLNPHHNSQV